jgi:hypothetical protein
MKNGKQKTVREIMMGSPGTMTPDDTLDLANEVIARALTPKPKYQTFWERDMEKSVEETFHGKPRNCR